MLKEEIERRGEFLMERFKEMAQQGPPIPGRRGTPAQRLQQYQRDTLPSEMQMLLDPNYLALNEAGRAPDPVPHVWYALYGGKQVQGPFATPEEAARYAMAVGLPMNPDGTPPIEPKHSFWSLLMQLPTKWDWTPFEYHRKDFLHLIELQAQHAEEKGLPL